MPIADSGGDKRISKWLRHPILEAIVGLVGAGFAWAPPFSSTTTALTIAVLGILLGVGRFALQEMLKDYRIETDEELASKFSRLDRLADVVDLTPRNDLSDVRLLVDRYSQIVDPEFHDAKEEIVRHASSQLNKILQERCTENLNTGAYYNQLKDILASVHSDETVYAVSTGEAIEWDDSPQEEAFFRSNLEIVRRGGKVVRFFVYEKAAFMEARGSNPKVAAHFDGSGLTGRFVDKDLLKSRDARLFSEIGQGFILVGKRIAIVDVFGDHPRGFVTKNRDEIDRFVRAIQQLGTMATS